MRARHAEVLCGHHVHRASEEILQCTLQGGVIEGARRLGEVDEEIAMAVGPRLAASHGPEYTHGERAMR